MAHDTTELVSAFQASGVSQKEFCADRGIAVSALQYHLSKVRKKKAIAGGDCEHEGRGRFIPLRVDGSRGRHHRTLVLIHGEIGVEEVAHLLRTVAG